MSTEFSKNFFVSTVVSELFTIESQLCSTRTADLFKAFDRERGRPVGVWMLRSQFDPNSTDVSQFANRLGKVAAIGGKMAKILTAGVDPTGVVFSVVSPLDGYPILGGNLDPVEAERRFIAAVRTLDQIHGNGIPCGDICGSSFWVSRDGEVNFVGIMGSFENNSSGPVPSVEAMNYLAPEQHVGGTPLQIHDVYALGVLGYQLFTREFPSNSSESGSKPTPIRERVPTAPPWIDEVILRCLDHIPNRRFASAGAMITGISETKERIIKEQSAIAGRDKSELATKSKNDGVITFQDSQKNTASNQVVESGMNTKRLMLIGGIVAFLMAFLVVIGIFGYQSISKNHDPVDATLEVHKEAANDRMRQAIDILQEDDAEIKDKRIKFQELQASDDPLAHDVLVRGAVDAKNVKVRLLAEKSILGRAKRLKLLYSAAVVENWFGSTNLENPPAEYVSILRAIDPTLPMEGRKSALKKIFETNPDIAVSLATALVLDSSAENDYQDIVADFLSAMQKRTDTAQHTVYSLLLLFDGISGELKDVIRQKIDALSDEDVRWILPILLEKGSSYAPNVAKLAIERRVYPPVRLGYLVTLRDREDLPDGFARILLKGAQGLIDSGDVELLGTWFDVDAQKVLFTICVDDVTDALRLEAFEYLSGRGLTIQPAGDFVQWVKNKNWEHRAELARPAGILALAEVFSEKEIEQGLDILKNYTKDKAMFDIVFDSPSSKVTTVALRIFGTTVPVRTIIKLLGNPNKDVRILAIHALKETNDVTVLRAVLALYDAEVDPEVKAAYKENLWVINQHEGK